MASSIVFVGVYTVVYCVIHSWLASQRMKNWAKRVFGPKTACWYRLAYNAVAGVTLLPLLVVLAFLPDGVLYAFPSPWRELAGLGQLVMVLGMIYGLVATDALHFLGIRQLSDVRFQECSSRQPPLAVFGLYRWVRHPLYLLSLILIWLTPYMTYNLATVFGVFSVYLYFGTFFEENRLVAEFGDAYRNYQRRVPRIFPWRGRAM